MPVPWNYRRGGGGRGATCGRGVLGVLGQHVTEQHGVLAPWPRAPLHVGVVVHEVLSQQLLKSLKLLQTDGVLSCPFKDRTNITAEHGAYAIGCLSERKPDAGATNVWKSNHRANAKRCLGVLPSHYVWQAHSCMYVSFWCTMDLSLQSRRETSFTIHSCNEEH